MVFSASEPKAETFSTSPLTPLNGIPRNLTEERSQRPLSSLGFRADRKKDGRPGL